MSNQPSDDIDEVALNTLLAEGVDLPTALEASRRNADGGTEAPLSPGCLVAAAIILALLIALRLWM